MRPYKNFNRDFITKFMFYDMIKSTIWQGERIFILVPNIFNYVILFVGFINLYSYSSAKGVNLFIMIGENLRQ